MPCYRVDVIEPTSVLGDGDDPRAAFVRIWELIPKDRPREPFCFLEQDGGLFLKGLVKPPGLSCHALRKSRRNASERRALVELARRGLPVPPLVAYGEERRALVTRRSFLMQRLIHDSVDLEQYLGEGLDASDLPRRRAVLERAGSMVAQLHAARCFHRDLAPRNLLVALAPGAPDVWLIDCPRASIDPPAMLVPGMRRADLTRLARGVLRLDAPADDVERLLAATGTDELDAVLAYGAAINQEGEAGLRRARRWFLSGR